MARQSNPALCFVRTINKNAAKYFRGVA